MNLSSSSPCCFTCPANSSENEPSGDGEEDAA
jgi:hypothetical protein